jgi:hypothetical protein
MLTLSFWYMRKIPFTSTPKEVHSCAAKSCLAHLVLRVTRNLPVHVFCLELVRDLDVQVTVVLLAWPGVEDTGYALTLLDGKDVLEVEDGLFPMGVLCVGAGGELDGLVAGGELNVEPRDDGVDEVGAANLQTVGHVEGEIGDGAGVEVEGEHGRRVGDDGLDVNGGARSWRWP